MHHAVHGLSPDEAGMLCVNNLIIISADFRRAPLPVRERLFMAAERAFSVDAEWRAGAAIESALVLSTADRVDLILLGASEDDLLEAAGDALEKRGGLAPADYWSYTTLYRHDDAVRYLVRIANGLDLAFPAGRYALNALTDLWHEAALHHPEAPLLNVLGAVVSSASQHGANRAAQPVAANVAIALARRHFGTVEGRRVLLIGSGELATSAGKTFQAAGALTTTADGSAAGARALASRLQCDSMLLAEAACGLPAFDIAISASFEYAAIGRAFRDATSRGTATTSLLAMDFSFPRTLAALADVPTVFYYDVDHLAKVWRRLTREECSIATDTAVTSQLAMLLGRERRGVFGSQLSTIN
jgi:glutamyl-tRNA reductase